MKNKIILIFGLCLLIYLLYPVQKTSAAAEIWELLEFEAGQSFTYELRREDEESETEGEAVFKTTDNQDGRLRLIIEGEFDGNSFEASASGKAGDIEDLFINFVSIMLLELPYEVNEILFYTIWRPWMETPLYQRDLVSGWEGQVTDEDGDNYWLSISDKVKYAELEGYLVQMESEGDDDYLELLEVSVNTELPLPLMARTELFEEEEMAIFSAELSSYRSDVAVSLPESENNLASRENELLEVVEYLRNNNLEIGETYQKAYKMIGAAAGFGLPVEGAEIELYLFDPETADLETLESLAAAKESGNFKASSLNMEFPVIMNGNIMLTGLEYGSHYSHPAKDKIIEVFRSYNSISE